MLGKSYQNRGVFVKTKMPTTSSMAYISLVIICPYAYNKTLI